MLDPDNDSLLSTVVFGQQVQDFLETDVGKYLVGRAEQEASEALEALRVVAPWRTRRIRQLQNQVWVAESVQRWLGNAIAEGLQARRVLEGNE